MKKILRNLKTEQYDDDDITKEWAAKYTKEMGGKHDLCHVDRTTFVITAQVNKTTTKVVGYYSLFLKHKPTMVVMLDVVYILPYFRKKGVYTAALLMMITDDKHPLGGVLLEPNKFYRLLPWYTNRGFGMRFLIPGENSQHPTEKSCRTPPLDDYVMTAVINKTGECQMRRILDD